MTADLERPFVEVVCYGNASGGNATYRYYGRGEWQVNFGSGWEVVNGIYVPGDVLKVAATASIASNHPFCSGDHLG